MALKSWSISEFTGADPSNVVGVVLIDSEANTVIMLSLIISYYGVSESPQSVWVERLDSFNNVLFHFRLDLDPESTPFAMDTKLILTSGHKLRIRSSAEDVAVDASGDES